MRKKIFLRLVGVTSALAGIALIASVSFPILSYELTNSAQYVSFLSPVPETDLTKASNWFVGGASPKEFKESKVSYYTLSIPALGISRATVAIGGEDLSDYLIQYPGTALPGKTGNAVIFGHSILPQFYDPENYLAIFSTLPTIKKGSEINVQYDGIYYQYRVQDKFEVSPTDLQVLEQSLDSSYLTLITCVPPGHPLRPKRLVVRAKVVPLEDVKTDSWN